MIKPCANCATPFKTRHPRVKYCGRKCRSRLVDVSKEDLLIAIVACNGFLDAVARRLGLSRMTTWRRVRDHGLDKAAKRLRVEHGYPSRVKYRPEMTPAERAHWLADMDTSTLSETQRTKIWRARNYWKKRAQSAA